MGHNFLSTTFICLYMVNLSVCSSTASPVVTDCSMCGSASLLVCPSCNNQCFCDACDDLYHRHPARAAHKRNQLHKPKPGQTQALVTALEPEVKGCVMLTLTRVILGLETCSICGISSVHARCSTCDQKLCQNCDRLYHSHPNRVGHNRTFVTPAKTRR